VTSGADAAAISHPIVLFDGVCNLCNYTVQWICRHDPHGTIHFAPLQSATAQRLLAYDEVSSDEVSSVDATDVHSALDSVVFIDTLGRVYTESDAILRICRHLNGPWQWLWGLRILPRPVRNAVYRMVAKHRYHWFGRQASCMVPTDALRDRFLND
jgi:predicted DCC family thiol-disulfide oxidoreductase YuxK